MALEYINVKSLSIGIFHIRPLAFPESKEQVDDESDKRNTRDQDPRDFNRHGAEFLLRRVHHGPDGSQKKRDTQQKNHLDGV